MSNKEGLNETNGGLDIPAEATSSVGGIAWPPVVASEHRKKGIFPATIETGDELLALINQFELFQFNPETSRFSARAFVDSNVIRTLEGSKKDLLALYLEGIIPLRGCGIRELGDCCLIYLGKNAVNRKTPQENVRREITRAQEIFSAPIDGRVHDFSDFRFELLTSERKNHPNIQSQYEDLYSAFGWGPSDVKKILENPSNILVAVFDKELLVSSGMGERADLLIQREGHPIRFVMYEITEAATKPEYRARGLYTQVANRLMDYLSQTDVNLIYAESNVDAPGVLKTARKQGRHSVLETFQIYNFEPKLLEQHVRISAGPNDNRPPNEKNDLLVTFIPRMELIERWT